MPVFDPTSASRAVLIEVMNVLGVFRDKIVLVGGWVPDLLYPNSGHIGSLDVDLAISQTAIGANAYESKEEKGYDDCVVTYGSGQGIEKCKAAKDNHKQYYSKIK